MADSREHSDPRKRKPGRPAGSVQYPQDQIALERIAWARLDTPLMPFVRLAERHGYKHPSEIKRLQRKWNLQEDELMADAKRRHETAKQRELGWFAELLLHLGKIAEWADAVMTSYPVEDALRKINQAQETHHALEREGEGMKPPFDVHDPQAIAIAIAEFETRPFKTLEDLEDSFEAHATVDDLPQSIKLYTQAMMFYSLALKAKAEETGHEIREQK